ncbi:MAG: cytochrome c oxidase subunit I [Thermoplasmatota archaeon]
MTVEAPMASRVIRLARWSRGWLLTTNHKRIGILYLITTFVWFLFAGFDGLAMRAELASPALNLFRPDLYDGLFTVHGTQMLFLFAIPVFSGFGNIFLPKMVGAKDMAFPKLNALSYWLILWAGVALRVPLYARLFPTAGWTSYAPLSLATYTSTTGEDWWIVAVFIETVASTITAINFLVTVHRERRKGVRYGALPLFVWGILSTATLAVVASPFLLAALTMLYLDRSWGTTFFDPSLPNGTLLWQHIFWFYSHPATYLMVLPAFGIIAEIIPAFSGRSIFSYRAIVYSLVGTSLFSMTVFWHHMFVTGQDDSFTTFSSITSFLVSVPTGVLFLTLLATLWNARIRLATPMLFALGVIVLFTIGGADGLYLAAVPIDKDLHGTFWVVGHIHFVAFGASVMGAIAGLYYWFPEIWGRRLHEGAGRWHFWFTLFGVTLTFFPMHFLGTSGMVRRIFAYAPALADLNVVSTIGAGITAFAQAIFLANIAYTMVRPLRTDDVSWGQPPRADDQLVAPTPLEPALVGGAT